MMMKSVNTTMAGILFLLTLSQGTAAATDISGTVTGKRGDSVKVEFEPSSSVGPKIGDRVDFVTFIEGFEVNAGQGGVTERGSDFVWVRISKGHPNLKMIGIIRATGPPGQVLSPQRESTVARHRCDELAANSLDDQRVAPGVAFDSIDVGPAITACENAVRQHPQTARFHYQLGRAYDAGGQDQKARHGYRQAAEQGSVIAQHNLGDLYRTGQGVSRDDVEAVKWFRLAAAKGFAASKFRLGYMYFYGEGVPQDGEIALKWYREAAEQGWAQAQNHLGYVYDRGIGVPRDKEEAKKWYSKAAAQGHEGAKADLQYLD